MKKNMFFILGGISACVLIITFVGCQKKSKMETSALESQAMLNEIVVAPDRMEAMAVTSKSQMAATQAAPSTTEMIESIPNSQSPATQGQESAKSAPTAKEIQQALTNAGLYSGKIDGSLGPKTKAAIKAFQEQNGLKADGKVGSKTWQKMKASLEAPAASGGQTAKVK